MSRHGTIVAYLALFVALGGTATAATQLGRNSVGSQEIRNGSVKPADLAKRARPIKATRSVAAFEAAVEDVMTTDQVLAALKDAVEGDAGPQGPKGEPAPGPQGVQGEQGKIGPRGAALGFALVNVSGGIVPDHSTSNARIVRPGSTIGVLCVGATDATVRNVSVMPTEYDPTVNLFVTPAGTDCAGYDLEIHAADDAGTAVGHGAIYVTLN